MTPQDALAQLRKAPPMLAATIAKTGLALIYTPQEIADLTVALQEVEHLINVGIPRAEAMGLKLSASDKADIAFYSGIVRAL